MMTSSGNLRADRRLEFALHLKAQGDLLAAQSVFEQTLEIEPEWEAAHFALAETLEAMGRHDEAVRHYVAHLRHADDDLRGASLKLALLGAATVPEKAPEAYVRALFDDYAPRFERTLIEKLEYRAPYQLRVVLDSLRPPISRGERILDLGCGTGLAGEIFKARASWLEGVDISPRMVAQAERKGIYDAVHVCEIEDFLARCTSRYDLVIAADVLIYFGALDRVMSGIHRILADGGLFAFTTQSGDGDGYRLGADQRYAHSRLYLEQTISRSGLSLNTCLSFVPRKEAGKDVAGDLCVLSQGNAAVTAPTAAEPAPPPEVPPLGRTRH